ncbi:hypothetical protein LJC08_04060 [Methanimicrococcus sp. OttesenSCG-928-J09]|nr:hypothetical protein [Methanimicrococcus sp. OttesenSCG-928-J09]
MEYIKCPACRMTDLEPTDIGKGPGDKYHCSGCSYDFSVTYKKTPQSVAEQYWKKALIAAIILL